MTLKTNYKNISWDGLRKYRLIENEDGTVSFLDMTEYINVQDAQVLANDLNVSNDLVNRIIAGEFFYPKAEIDTEISRIDDALDDKADVNHNHDSAYSAIGHNHDDRYYTESEIDTEITRIDNDLDDKADVNHNHDERYYTESETDTLLDGKSNTNHNHDSAYSAIGHNHDSLYSAIGHDHNNLYNTKTEIANLLLGKVDIVNTAEFHNSICRGKDITSYYTDGSLKYRIGGTNGYKLFEDLWLGDTITRNGRTYMIVDFDYYIRCGETDIAAHHIVLMPIGNMSIPAGTVLYGSSDTLTFLNGSDVTSKETATAFKWNATAEAPNTNTTAGGYKYSRMRTVIMKACDTLVMNDFGSNYITPITVLYPNPADAAASGLASGWTWFNSTDWNNILRRSICDLPNETQIYGQQVWGRGSVYTNVGYEVGIDKWQFSYFRMNRDKVNIRATWWLRSVHSAANAAYVNTYGSASSRGSATAFGVRPRFLLFG